MSNSLNQRLVVRDRGRFQTVDLLCIERMRLGMGVIQFQIQVKFELKFKFHLNLKLNLWSQTLEPKFH